MPADDVTRSLQIDPDIGAVEVKITAQAKDEDLVESKLKLAGIEAEHRKVFFFDTPDLTLFEGGVVLRARMRDGDDDSTVMSTKSEPGDAADATHEFLALLAQHGIDTEGDQQTKTRAALRFFTTGDGID